MVKRAKPQPKSYIKLYLTSEVRDQIRDIAAADGRAVSPYLFRLLVKHIKDMARKKGI